tara:strand:+ start:443 stop:625 length:183 start_codon:yes stop_codon:yes gene_type:complete
MPGSPYLEEPPKKLTTWKRVLSFSIPILLVSIFLAVTYDLVIEVMIAYTLFFALTAILRK